MNVLVIVPTLNRPQMCARAVDSLMAQRFATWECVIAKNGGADDLGSYVAELGPRLNDSRIQMQVLPDSGLAYALNEAIASHLRGHDAFANLEDDDEWHPDFLAKMSTALKSDAADVANCLQRQAPRALQADGGQAIVEVLRSNNYINFPMCLFKSRLVKKVGKFSPGAGPACDWDWHLRCLHAGAHYVYLPEPLVTHHWHGDNWCTHDNSGDTYVRRNIKRGKY